MFFLVINNLKYSFGQVIKMFIQNMLDEIAILCQILTANKYQKGV